MNVKEADENRILLWLKIVKMNNYKQSQNPLVNCVTKFPEIIQSTFFVTKPYFWWGVFYPFLGGGVVKSIHTIFICETMVIFFSVSYEDIGFFAIDLDLDW